MLKILVCPKCQFSYILCCFTDLDAMIAQSMSQVVDEAGTRLWNCNLCNRTNKDKTDIRRHMEKHFKVKHNCPHCDKQASSREALRVHIYRHHR